ncbi:347_t:CDS:2, partial [Dentiscutata erythropus]
MIQIVECNKKSNNNEPVNIFKEETVEYIKSNNSELSIKSNNGEPSIKSNNDQLVEIYNEKTIEY